MLNGEPNHNNHTPTPTISHHHPHTTVRRPHAAPPAAQPRAPRPQSHRPQHPQQHRHAPAAALRPARCVRRRPGRRRGVGSQWAAAPDALLSVPRAPDHLAAGLGALLRRAAPGRDHGAGVLLCLEIGFGRGGKIALAPRGSTRARSINLNPKPHSTTQRQPQDRAALVGSLPPLVCLDVAQGSEQQVGGESYLNHAEARAVVEVGR